MPKQKMRSFILWYLVNNDRPLHAELVMNGTDVIESAWRCEGHPKAGYTRRRLGEPGPILRCRRQKTRVNAVRGRADYRVPGPVRGRQHICRRRPGIRRLR